MSKILMTTFFFLLTSVLTSANLFAAFDSAEFNQGSSPLELTRITPKGEDVPPARQIVFSFNRPVVPVGRMERDASEIPITITPSLDCEWRWLNTSSLACQLGEKEKMLPATKYSIVVSPGIKREDGITMLKTFTHTFITQRPKVTSAWFNTWEAPGMPLIQVRFDQPVDPSSVSGHLFFWLNNSGKRVALSIVDDPELMKHYRYMPKDTFFFIRPASGMPLDEAVDLSVEPGIKPVEGSEQGIENRVVNKFYTFPQFEFLGLRCYSNDDREVVFTQGDKLASQERCNPLNSYELLFSAPVIKDEIEKSLVVNPDLAGGRKDYDPWQNVYSYSRLAGPHNRGQSYAIPFPEVLKSYESYSLKAVQGAIKDEFGRPLTDGIDLAFNTDHRKPDYFIKSYFSVLEKGVDSEVPMVITNLDQIDINFETLMAQDLIAAKKTLYPAKAKDISYNIPLQVRTLALGNSAVVKGELSTVPHVPKGEYGNRFFAQVTPYNVHVKLGHFNTIVWVTDFATGQPVEGVSVDVFEGDFSAFKENPEILNEAKTDSKGIAVLWGTEKLDPRLELVNRYYYYDELGGRALFVRCVKGNDIALVPLIHSFSVEERGTNNTYISTVSKKKFKHIHTWGTTAQGVYKVGDTVQYKLYVRNQDNERFVMPPREGYSLKVMDPMGKTVNEVKELTLSEFGAFHGEFTVPKTGAVGWYRFVLSAHFDKSNDDIWEPMRVLISDFTPSPFKVTTDLNGELFQPGDEVKVTTAARLHAGGPYVDAQTRITARLKKRAFRPKDAKASGFYFDTYNGRLLDTVHQSENQIDNEGNLESSFKLKDTNVLYGQLEVESAVRDDRGKYIANSATAVYVGRDRYVGIRQPDWVLNEDKPALIEALVVNEYGKPVDNTAIKIAVEYRKTTASRVKSAGNAYTTRYHHEWISVHHCDLTSSATEAVNCEFTPTEAGSYRMTAVISDTKGRHHSSTTSRWVAGKGMVLWEMPNDNTLNIYPEKEETAVGEKARYLVQNPFPGAKALITIERYGVLKSWVETFEDSMEIIEFDVDPEYIPGYYLSVTVMSPRVEKPLGEGNVDLGKPAFRTGYVEATVKDKYKEISVQVVPGKEEYKPRDKVTVDFVASFQGKSGSRLAEPVELAIAVLDESVLDLISGGKQYFDPYKGFYYLEPLDMRNFSLITQLVGRQKFEKKGANAGGGGGPDLNLRSLFKFVSYWNPSLKTDEKGRASITFDVPDNLTGWRILAMAVTPGDRMGLGDASFRVNQPTEIRPVLPNQVTEGDSFVAGFSVMNRTDKVRQLKVNIKAEGNIDKAEAGHEESVTTEPYKRYTVWMPVKSKGDGKIKFSVRAGDDFDKDGLVKEMVVHKAASLETAATYGTTTADKVSENIAIPENIRTDVGSLSLVLSPTVLGNVEGAFKYMRDYPYICWEQKLTKGAMAAHYINLKDYMPQVFEWPASDKLVEETLREAASFQAPNGGMVYYIPEDIYVSPYLSAYTAIVFNWLRAGGYQVPEQVEEKLHQYLERLIRNDVMPDFYSKGMASSVRAVALAALAPHGKITLSDLNRYKRHLPEMSLFGKAQYLNASMKVKGSDLLQEEVVNMIMSHANETGGKFIFSESLDEVYERILATPLRDNCAILTSLLEYSEESAKGKSIGDVPYKLVRTITQTRGKRDHWENTQENMFCMNALTDFSRVYENEKPDMTVKATFSKKMLGETAFKDLRDNPRILERPLKAGDEGKKDKVLIERKGSGRLYYAARLSYALRDLKTDPVNSGIEIHREYSVERDGKWILLKSPMEIKRGELVKVDIFLSIPSARNFVVVDDPVPGGLEPVNRDLATSSAVDADKASFTYAGDSYWHTRDDWYGYGYSRWSFYHKELRHHSVRFYSEYLPAGNYHLNYVAQAIAAGQFLVMPVHSEEMYDPDVFGKGIPASLVVE